jgi:hypothetical protein
MLVIGSTAFRARGLQAGTTRDSGDAPPSVVTATSD